MDEEFPEILEKYREKVFNELIKYISKKESSNSDLNDYYNILQDYPMRKGKYLRPTFILLTCEMFNGDVNKAINTAVAVQLSEEWILIHDDIEDNSEIRRGKPCLHKIYGVPIAVNVGDNLHIIMWNALMKNKEILGVDLTYKIAEILNKTLKETAEGQHLEIKWTQEVKEDFSDDDYYKIVEKKTCLYSITTPMILGAIIANVDEEKYKFIYEFGDYLGKAFQIQDDVLNLIGDEKSYGKEIAGDIKEGKLTLIFAHLIRTCNAEEKKKIIEIYKKHLKKTKRDVEFVLNLMKKYRSIEYANEKAKEFTKKAKEIFEKSTKDIPENKGKIALRKCIDFIISRKV